MLLDRLGVPIRYCSNPGCRQRAVRYLEIAVPPTGRPMSEAVKATLGLTLCRRCADKERVETFLTDQTRALIAGMVAKSPIPPDFNRARLNVRVIGDPDWERAAAIAAEGRARRFG